MFLMMWYGFLFYFAVVLLFIIFIFFYIRIFTLKKINKKNYASVVTLLFLLFILFLFFFSLFFTYFFYFKFESFFLLFSSNLTLVDSALNFNFFSFAHFSTNLVFVYYFPFIYIFLIITILSILFCLSYNTNEISTFSFYCVTILIAGFSLFFTDSFVNFFFAYEMLLIPSFFILYKFAKTRRCVEAAYLMFFWTQFGALFLIFSFIYIIFSVESTSFESLSYYQFSNYEVNFLFFCWIIGFGVKLPIWPFYGWLPKAHVEASTNFSIFLSGVLVKFAFFGLLKCLISLKLEPTLFQIFPFLAIGITDAVLKLFYQIDLKKLVAYSTVVEMHWLTICIISGQSCLVLSGFCMLISHALLSTNSFLLVDAVNRRYKTRLITEISGINFLNPKLFLASLINCLVFLGFPGSIFFIAEFLFFSYFFDMFPLLATFFLLFLYFFGPSFFFRSWINVLFGSFSNSFKKIPNDLNSKESILYFGLLLLMFWLGFTWQCFYF